MNKKIGILALIAFLVVLVGAVLFYVFSFSKKGEELPVSERPETTNQETNKAAEEVKTVEAGQKLGVNQAKGDEGEKPEVSVGQVDLERIAKSFAERFGSFSNQSNFSNITDLEMFMSEKMKKWAESYIKSNQKDNVANQIYYGLTTQAMTAKSAVYDAEKGLATVVVDTRRREAMGTTSNNSKFYNQSIKITFVKENQAWKVDSATWQE